MSGKYGEVSNKSYPNMMDVQNPFINGLVLREN
jgi:hypothetical protein